MPCHTTRPHAYLPAIIGLLTMLCGSLSCTTSTVQSQVPQHRAAPVTSTENVDESQLAKIEKVAVYLTFHWMDSNGINVAYPYYLTDWQHAHLFPEGVTGDTREKAKARFNFEQSLKRFIHERFVLALQTRLPKRTVTKMDSRTVPRPWSAETWAKLGLEIPETSTEQEVEPPDWPDWHTDKTPIIVLVIECALVFHTDGHVTMNELRQARVTLPDMEELYKAGSVVDPRPFPVLWRAADCYSTRLDLRVEHSVEKVESEAGTAEVFTYEWAPAAVRNEVERWARWRAEKLAAELAEEIGRRELELVGSPGDG
jgi:hypothetical protein